MSDKGRPVQPHRSGGGQIVESKPLTVTREHVRDIRLQAESTATAAWECYKRQTDWHGGGERISRRQR